MKCYYWERKVTKQDRPEQLQVVAVFAEDLVTAHSQFYKCAGKTIMENVLTDILETVKPKTIPEGAQEVFQMLLNRYTIQEAEGGKIARLYKYTPGRVILILGKNTKPIVDVSKMFED